MELGILSLGEHLSDPATGAITSPAARLDEIVRAARLGDRAGFWGFALGEHHSPHYLASTPPVLLAAIAAQTERIRLRCAVSLIVNLDPVRVAEDYATLDLLSAGRLDLVVGRGIYPEPFQLFGPDPADAEDRYIEHIDLLVRLLTETNVTWTGASSTSRAPLTNATTLPRPLQDPLPVWIALGMRLASAELAAERGLPVMLGGAAFGPANYQPLIERYREALVESGHVAAPMSVAATSHCHVAPSSQLARARWEPHYRHYFSTMSKTSNLEPAPIDFKQRLGPDGPAICGSPAEVIDKLLMFHELYGHDVHFLQLDLGGQPFDLVQQSIELLATEVLPEVRRATSVVSEQSAPADELVS